MRSSRKSGADGQIGDVVIRPLKLGVTMCWQLSQRILKLRTFGIITGVPKKKAASWEQEEKRLVSRERNN